MLSAQIKFITKPTLLEVKTEDIYAINAYFIAGPREKEVVINCFIKKKKKKRRSNKLHNLCDIESG